MVSINFSAKTGAPAVHRPKLTPEQFNELTTTKKNCGSEQCTRDKADKKPVISIDLPSLLSQVKAEEIDYHGRNLLHSGDRSIMSIMENGGTIGVFKKICGCLITVTDTRKVDEYLIIFPLAGWITP